MEVADVELDLDPPRSGHALQWLLVAFALVLSVASVVLAIANQRGIAPGEFGFPPATRPSSRSARDGSAT